MKIIFIAGPHGCGKTKATEILINTGITDYSFDTGPLIRIEHQKSEIPKIEDWVAINEKKYGQHFTDNIILRKIFAELSRKDLTNKTIVILGYRTFDGLCYLLKKIGEVFTCHYYFLYIDTLEHIAHQRFNKRDGVNLSSKEFHEKWESQKVGLLQIANESDYYIMNDGSEKELSQKLQHFSQYLATF